jgi:NAD(P)H dehydrogenase (quinone)
MKAGIFVHSRTGNTLSAAEKIQKSLEAGGHTAVIERVTAEGENPGKGVKFRLKNIPDTSPYDVLIFGAPVNGFSLSLAMKAYLEQLPQLQGKQTVCFVTEQFPKPWMGGNNSIKQMKALLTKKGAEIKQTGIVNWSAKTREDQIAGIAGRFAKI